MGAETQLRAFQWNCPYFEASAKDGVNVEEVSLCYLWL